MALDTISLDQVCSGELCERAFDLISVGAPSVIALFLIIYAVRSLSGRLKEASDAGHRNNARIYGILLCSVWFVALVMLVTHAGVFVVNQMVRPATGTAPGYIEGAFRDFEGSREVNLESRPERLYMQAGTGGNNWEWIIRGTPPLKRETFKIVSGGTTLRCTVDLGDLPEGPPDLVELTLDRVNAQPDPVYRLMLLPRREENIFWDCESKPDDPQHRPSNDAPLGARDTTAPGGFGSGASPAPG